MKPPIKIISLSSAALCLAAGAYCIIRNAPAEEQAAAGTTPPAGEGAASPAALHAPAPAADTPLAPQAPAAGATTVDNTPAVQVPQVVEEQPPLPAKPESVQLTPELEQLCGPLNRQLAQYLREEDMSELKKGELLWDAKPDKLKAHLEKMLDKLSTGGAGAVADLFQRAYSFTPNQEETSFVPNLQYTDEPVLYADASYIVTRRNGEVRKSSVYTFWDAATCRQVSSISLPGAVYCPVPTADKTVYRLVMVRASEPGGDYLTWHRKPCISCYYQPETGSFATEYLNEDGLQVPATRTIGNPASVFKNIAGNEESYVNLYSGMLENADDQRRDTVEKALQELRASFIQSGGLPFIGKAPYMFTPIKVEPSVSHRLPWPTELVLASDRSGNQAAVVSSDGGPSYMTLNLDTLENKRTFIPNGRVHALDFSQEGQVKLTPNGRAAELVDALHKKLNPYPSRYNSHFNKEESFDCVTVSQARDKGMAFACSTGNLCWQVAEGASINEILGLVAPNGRNFVLNPYEAKLNTPTPLDDYSVAVRGTGSNNVQGGTSLVQVSGKYRLLEFHNTGIRKYELIVCKQRDQNKEDIFRIAVNLSAGNYTVVSHREAPVYRLSPLWIAKKKWFLQPESDFRYSIRDWGTANQDRHVADLYLDPASCTYAVVLEDGRYAGSPGCETLLENADKEGNKASLSVFAPWRNRPGEVLEAIGGNPDDVVALKQTTARWLGKMKKSKRNGAEPALASLPKLHVAKLPLHTDSDTVRLPIRLTARGKALERLSVLADGVELLRGKDADINVQPGETAGLEREITLVAGQNWIEVTAYDSDDNPSEPVRFRVLCDKEAPADLYVVAMGISHYEESDLNLQYAAKDATDLAAAMKQYGMGANKHVLLLTDEQVKKETALAEIARFLSTAKREDRVLLYCAGHGLLDASLKYNYAPYGVNPDNIEQTGIPMEDLVECLDSTPARRRLLLLDTCHAGALGEAGEDKIAANGISLPHDVTEVHARGMKVRQVPAMAQLDTNQKKRYIEDMFSTGTKFRGVTIMAASAGAEYAQESGEWKNGIFTASLIKALKRDAAVDQDADGVLSLEELQQYLGGIVPAMTGGAQSPSIVSAEDCAGFPLSADLAYYVGRRDWEGLETAAASGIRVNEGVYPDSQALMCTAMEHSAPEPILETLMQQGANPNRPRLVISKSDTVTLQEETPASLTGEDAGYADFDLKKVNFCRKYGYGMLKLRRMFRKAAQD